MTEKVVSEKYLRALLHAHLGHYTSFTSYLFSYKTAFDILLNQIKEERVAVDVVAYPILFIARHCLELGFKLNIRWFKQYSKKEDYQKANTHNLEGLFSGFKLHVRGALKSIENLVGHPIDKTDIEEFESYCTQVEKLTSMLHTLDMFSDSFRYPIDKKGSKSFEPNIEIDLLDIEELFQQSMTLLMFTADVFSKYTSYADAINKMYEEELRRHYESY